MPTIVSKLRKLGKDKHLDMSGKHTIAECLHEFGGKDKREISKSIKGAIEPLATPLLAFSGTGEATVQTMDVSATLSYVYGESSLHVVLDNDLPSGQTITQSFASACNATLEAGEYKFVSDITATGIDKGFLLCNASNNQILASSNSGEASFFALADTSVSVYLKLKVTGPFSSGTYNFKLVKTG